MYRYFEEMRSSGITPTSHTYNILIDSFAKRRENEQVEKYYNELRSNNFLPTANTFNSIFEGFGKRGSDQKKRGKITLKKVKWPK
jgi:pentatricopeptide repeat protein